MDAETRAYLDQALGSLRGEFGELRQDVGALRQDVGALRQEFGTVRQEFGTVRQEFGTLRQEFGALRQEVRDTAVETRRHFDVVAESLRRDIRAVAEGVAANSERIDRVEVSLRSEMGQGFAATHAVFRAALSDLRRDID